MCVSYSAASDRWMVSPGSPVIVVASLAEFESYQTVGGLGLFIKRHRCARRVMFAEYDLMRRQ